MAARVVTGEGIPEMDWRLCSCHHSQSIHDSAYGYCRQLITNDIKCSCKSFNPKTILTFNGEIPWLSPISPIK